MMRFTGSQELVLLGVPLAAFLFTVLAHVCLTRSGIGLLKALLAAYVSSVVLVVALHLELDRSFMDLVSSWMFFSALWYCFFHYVNIGEASLRIRMLNELAATERGLSRAQLLEEYNNEKIVRTRVERLLRDGQIRAVGERYVLGRRRFLFLVYFFRFLTVVVHGKRRS